MPPKLETDPVILEQRRLRNREATRLRMQKHRSKGKELATTLLGQALERVGGTSNPRMSIGEHQSLADRTAQALVKGTLRRHGVTLERLVKAAAEALEAVKFRRVGDEITSQPDFGNRLRAIETFLRLFQNIGEIPDSKHREPYVPISVKVLVVGENYEELRVSTTEAE
jgi:hypothetical protein